MEDRREEQMCEGEKGEGGRGKEGEWRQGGGIKFGCKKKRT